MLSRFFPSFLLLSLLVHVLHAYVVTDTEALRRQYSQSMQRVGKEISNSFVGIPSTLFKTKNRTARRRLLQESSCAWDEESGTCMPSDGAIIPLLSRSNNTISQLLLSIRECETVYDKKACNKLDACRWKIDAEICEFVDFAVGNEDSPCVQKAPKTIRLFSAASYCPIETSKKTCNALVHCEWDSELETCNLNFGAIYFGKSFDKLMTDIDDLVLRHVEVAIYDYAVIVIENSPDFDWNSALEWKVAPLHCPSGRDPKICAFSSEFVSGFLPTFLYCHGRYAKTNLSVCTNDHLCAVDDLSGSCSKSPAVAEAATLEALLGLVRKSISDVDQDFLETLITCFSKEKDNCTDQCEWSDDQNKCSLSVTAAAAVISKAGKNSEDGVCSFFDYYADSECIDIKDSDTCLKNKKCEYDPIRERCFLSDLGLYDAAFKDEPRLKKRYDRRAARCARRNASC